MAKEHQPGGIEESRLPLPNFKLFCEQLYFEGLAYSKLLPEIFEKVGVHTSIRLHNHPQGDGRWASIHYREGLESLADNKTQFAWGKAFLKNIAKDLHLLSKRLTGDLRDVDMIYGLSHVSANWGGNHGFKTQPFSKHPTVIEWHIQSIAGMPPQTNDQAPLTLFIIDREEFIRQYHREDSNDIKALVSDPVGN